MKLKTQQIQERNPRIAHFTPGVYSLRNAVLEVLQHTPHYLCETEDDNPPSASEVEALHLIDTKCDAGISLYAKTCYRGAVAENITAALAEHFNLSGSHIHNIHLCLHEAVVNGVIHGNLSVPGIFKSREMLGGYYEWIEARLATPALSFSRIQILVSHSPEALILEVIDQGRGYQYQEYLRDGASLDLHQGLNLIRTSCDRMSVFGYGNHIKMEFAL